MSTTLHQEALTHLQHSPGRQRRMASPRTAQEIRRERFNRRIRDAISSWGTPDAVVPDVADACTRHGARPVALEGCLYALRLGRHRGILGGSGPHAGGGHQMAKYTAVGMLLHWVLTPPPLWSSTVKQR